MRASSRFAPTVLFFTILFVVLEGRFFYLQILRGEDFRERARISVIARERIPPRRGRIRDRNGKILADNVASFHLTVTPHYSAAPGVRAEVLDRLGDILRWSEEETRLLETQMADAIETGRRWEALRIPGDLQADTCPHDGAQLVLAKEPEELLYCPDTDETLRPIDLEASYCPFDGKRLVWEDDAKGADRTTATCPKCDRRFATRAVCPGDHDSADVVHVHHNLQCEVCKRTYTNEVAAVRTVLYELPGVNIRTRFDRIYPFHYDAAHLLGYINRVTAEDREKFPGVYALHDTIGRTGIERALEAQLRGTSGEALYIKDARGHRRASDEIDGLGGETAFSPAIPGHDVWLTIDIDMQKEVRRALRYYKSGAAVVMDPRTGEIIATYSKPGYDPNDWSGRLSKEVWEETQANPYTPLLNKALTPYAPGSVYKIVTGVAALQEGVITPDTTIECPGHYEFGGRRFHCHNRGGHGHVDMIEAIKHSCDVYFYRVGEMLGMDRLAHYGEMFGFGGPSGIEVGERTGRVPTKTWHADNTSLGWQPGLTLSTAIGQGSLTTSPVQVARSFMAIANGGYVLNASAVHQITDHEGSLVRRFAPTVQQQLVVGEDHASLVRAGLVGVVNDPDGGAYSIALPNIVMAGKTGTAEAAQVRADATPELAVWLLEDHSWFAAYAPADDPQMVVTVFVEHGGWGSKTAAPIARKIVQSWLRLGLYDPAPADADDAAADDPLADDPLADDPLADDPLADDPLADDPAAPGPDGVAP